MTDGRFQEFLTVEQVAELLQLDADTIRMWIRTKYLPAMKIGRSWRIDRVDLTRMLEELRSGPDTPAQASWHQPPTPPALADNP